MADVTIRRTGELLRKLFEILMAHPEGVRAKDALAELESKVELTDYEKANILQGDDASRKWCVLPQWIV